jgi:hypothetical protein
MSEESWFYSRQGRYFSLLQSVRIVSGGHPASDSVVIGVKRPAREAGHSPSSVEPKNWQNCTTTFPYAFVAYTGEYLRTK